MSAIEKINNSGLSPEEKNDLKALTGQNVHIKNSIIQDDQVTDALLRKYLQADFYGKNKFLARLGLTTPIDQLGFHGSISIFVCGSCVSLRSAYFLSLYVRSESAGDTAGAQRWAARGKFPPIVLQEAPKYLSEYKARPRLWGTIPIGFLVFEIIKSGVAGAYRFASKSKVSED